MEPFEWDDDKAASNLAKHGIDFAEAIVAFYDPQAIMLVDENSAEERYQLLAMDGLGTRTESRQYAAGEP